MHIEMSSLYRKHFLLLTTSALPTELSSYSSNSRDLLGHDSDSLAASTLRFSLRVSVYSSHLPPPLHKLYVYSSIYIPVGTGNKTWSCSLFPILERSRIVDPDASPCAFCPLKSRWSTWPSMRTRTLWKF